MLATHQLRVGPPVLSAPPPPPAPADASALPAEVFVPGGPFTMGTSTEAWALDNERPAHVVHVPAFYLDTTPVTNAAYAEFIADGGYDDPRWWTADGWAHRQRAGLTAPLFWRWEGEWVRVSFGVTAPIIPNEPVLHVCWYEADAYARWAGRRLPTEAEWEKAARHDPAAGRSRRYPWGDGEPDPVAGQPGPAAPAARAGRLLPGGRGAVAGRGSSSATCGSGRARTSCRTPGSSRGRTRSTRRCSSGRSTRCCAAGRSGCRRWRAAARSGTGTTPSGGRSSRASGPRGRLPERGALMCRHLAYLGPPVPLRAVLIDPPHSLYRQAWAPRDAAARHGERRRVRGRLVRRRRSRPGQVPAGGADLGRPVAARPGPGHPVGRGAGGGARRHPGYRAGRGRCRAVRFRTLAVQPQRRARRLAWVGGARVRSAQ